MHWQALPCLSGGDGRHPLDALWDTVHRPFFLHVICCVSTAARGRAGDETCCPRVAAWQGS